MVTPEPAAFTKVGRGQLCCQALATKKRNVESSSELLMGFLSSEKSSPCKMLLLSQYTVGLTEIMQPFLFVILTPN